MQREGCGGARERVRAVPRAEEVARMGSLLVAV